MSAHAVTESTVVEAPPEVVFAILADPQQHPRIDGSGSLQGNIRGPERLGEGSAFGVDMKLFGLPYRIRNRVVEFEEGRLIAWRHFGAHRWRYELEPVDGGGSTRVTESFDYSRYSLPGRKGLELTGFPERNRRGIRETLRRLATEAAADAGIRPGD
jgi:uncharacterized protein YndB with AHSA1/START domain